MMQGGLQDDQDSTDLAMFSKIERSWGETDTPRQRIRIHCSVFPVLPKVLVNSMKNIRAPSLTY
jgi:hypothetical protein